MTYDQLPKAYRLWWDINHSVEEFCYGLAKLNAGEFAQAHLGFVVAGVKCAPIPDEFFVDDELPARGKKEEPRQESLFQ